MPLFAARARAKVNYMVLGHWEGVAIIAEIKKSTVLGHSANNKL